MVVRSRLSEQCAASLARALARTDEPAQDAPEDSAGAVADAPVVPAAAPGGGRFVWPFVAVLLIGLAAVAGTAPTHAVVHRPGLLVLLVACTVALDLMRIDVFERINLSPASVPALALAFLFGPLGPIAGELAIAGVRIIRRVPAVKWAFDVGMLGLAGSAAAGVWSAFAPRGVGAEIAAGAAAGVVAYLVTSLLLPGVIQLARGEGAFGAWREQLAWMWPHYVGFGALGAVLVQVYERIGVPGILLCAFPVFLLWVGEQQYVRRSRAGVVALRERGAELEIANARITDLLEHAHMSYLQAITTLGHALQAREPDGAGRTERVSQLARILGEAMGMEGADLDALTVGVVLHDIGRVCLRPREDPRTIPALSAEVLGPLDLPPIVLQMARSHGERFDGGGQPDALRGSAIPLAARIVAVADALDELTTPTATSPGTPLPDAMRRLRTESGTRFCPGTLNALQRCLNADPSLRRYFGERVGDVPFAA